MKERAIEVGLNNSANTKKKAMVQNRRTIRVSKILTIKDHDEVVGSFKYLGTVINNTKDKTDKIKARILAANKAYSSLHTIFRSKKSTEIIK